MTSWYAWGEQKSSAEDYSPVSSPAFLLGPTLAIKLSENFTLTFVYLYGKFDYEDKDNISRKFKSKRSDADLALNYRLNDYFKVFGGIKYFSYDMLQVPSNHGIYTYKNDGKHTTSALGLGLTATFPIADNLFLLATLSGFYGSIGNDKDKIINTSTLDREKIGFQDFGINSNLSMAYYITGASTTINLGVRYQYFKIKYESRNNDKWQGITMDNTIYGITLTATYFFNI